MTGVKKFKQKHQVMVRVTARFPVSKKWAKQAVDSLLAAGMQSRLVKRNAVIPALYEKADDLIKVEAFEGDRVILAEILPYRNRLEEAEKAILAAKALCTANIVKGASGDFYAALDAILKQVEVYTDKHHTGDFL